MWLWIIVFVIGITYGVLLLRVYQIWISIPSITLPESYLPQTFISVVVAARNEEIHLSKCIDSVLGQDFPADLFELIIVDDESDDRTPYIIRSYGDKVVSLRIGGEKKGKKNALTAGIENARGNLIATTDADCVVPVGWLKSFVYLYEKGALFIVAPVLINPSSATFQQFQALDMAAMMVFTGTGIHSGFHYTCNGANLAFDKDVFKRLGGYESHIHLASGDDIFLIHSFSENQLNDKIKFVKSNCNVVFTPAVPDLKGFIAQRIRWASKAGAFKDWKTVFVLIMHFGIALAIVIFTVIALFYGSHFFWAALALLFVKGVFDFIILKEAVAYFGEKEWLKKFLPSLIIHTLYISSIGIASQIVRSYKWKGRHTR